MARDVILWLAGVPLVVIIGLHLFWILALATCKSTTANPELASGFFYGCYGVT